MFRNARKWAKCGFKWVFGSARKPLGNRSEIVRILVLAMTTADDGVGGSNYIWQVVARFLLFKAYFKHRISIVSNWIQLNPVLIESVIQTPNLFATNQIDSSEHTVLLSAEFRKLWRFRHLLTTKWRTGGIGDFCLSIWHKLWVSTNQECEGWSDKKWWFFFFLLRVLYMNKVQEYNNLNRTAGKMDQIHDRVPSTNTEIVRHLELGSLEAQLLDKTEEVNSNC